MNKLSTLIEETKALKAKMQNEGKAALKEAFSEFFAAHPEAKAIVWTQYAPYFNDGEACVFGVREFELKLDAGKVADDVRKALEASAEDREGDEDYHHGDDNQSNAVRAVAKDKKTRGYYSAEGVTPRPLTDAERSLLDDFDALAEGCREIEDVLELTFGNHVKVVATRKGFKVSEYEHD